MTTQNLTAMTNDELDALIDGLEDGTVSAADPGALFDAALTERFDPRRGTVTLPLEPVPAPSTVTMILV